MGENDMRKLMLAMAAAAIATVPVATVVQADDTTVIHKNDGMGDHKTIIKKPDDDRLVGPREEKKVIEHRD
jgi:hypothetical protein